MNLRLVLATCCVLVVQISAESFVCPGIGRYPIPDSVDCKTYYTCGATQDGDIVASISRCPGGNLFDVSLLRCVGASSYTCPGPVTSTTEASTSEITLTESPNGFVCPSEGRYPNPESVDCKTYYVCTMLSDGIIVAFLSKCPGTNIYDRSLKRCVGSSSNTCPNEVTSSTEESSTESVTTSEPITTTIVSSTETTIIPEPTTTTAEPSTDEPTTQEPTTTTAEPSTNKPTTSEPTTVLPPNVFACVVSGRFPNPEQPDCQTYKYCLQTAASTFQEYTFRCPAGSNFNSAEARCTVGYICPKTLTTTTTEAPTTTVAAKAFVCETEGRFADPESCNQYIFCTRVADGSLVQHAFRCPPNSWFKPNESRCSASYVCK